MKQKIYFSSICHLFLLVFSVLSQIGATTIASTQPEIIDNGIDKKYHHSQGDNRMKNLNNLRLFCFISKKNKFNRIGKYE
jgi:hypothetical protein